jgi:hypothetical protein
MLTPIKKLYNAYFAKFEVRDMSQQNELVYRIYRGHQRWKLIGYRHVSNNK